MRVLFSRIYNRLLLTPSDCSLCVFNQMYTLCDLLCCPHPTPNVILIAFSTDIHQLNKLIVPSSFPTSNDP